MRETGYIIKDLTIFTAAVLEGEQEWSTRNI